MGLVQAERRRRAYPRHLFQSIACLAAMLLAAVPVAAAQIVLWDVPNYDWHHGCSPTAGAMVLGYWDAHGYPNLIPGSSSLYLNRSAIEDAIASPEHVADYALYNGVDDSTYVTPYKDKSELGGAHADNCLADFMGTSRSILGLTYGGTFVDHIGPGLEAYAMWRGYSLTAGGTWATNPAWSDFIKEIQFGRPVELGVDSDGDGNLDHSVAAMGYRTTNGHNEYLCRNTWGQEWWERFRIPRKGRPWGVGSMATLRPAGTTDSAWKVTSGDWNAAGSWTSGVPTSSVFAYLPAGDTATVSASADARAVQVGGTLAVRSPLAVQDARVLDGGRLSFDTSAAGLTVASMLINDGTVSHSAGTVTVSDSVIVGSTASSGALYGQTGGTLAVANRLIVRDVQDEAGAMHTGVFRISAGELHVSREIALGYGDDLPRFSDGPAEPAGGGRLEWFGGAIFTPKLKFGKDSCLSMGMDFSMDDLVTGALLHGGLMDYYQDGLGHTVPPAVEVTYGATATHASSSVTLGPLAIGIGGSAGTYHLSGSAGLDANVSVGSADSTGTFEQTGGTLQGNLSVLRGTFTQGGGAVSVSDLTVGGDAAHAAVYTLNDGALSAGAIHVSPGGTLAVAVTAEHNGALYACGGTLDVAPGRTFTVAGTYGDLGATKTLTKTGGGTMTVAGPQAHASAAGLIINAGTLNVNTDAGDASHYNLSITAGSTSVVTFGATQHLASLTLNDTATATVTSGGTKTLVTKSFSLAGGSSPTAKLDLTDNNLIVDYPDAGPDPYAQIRDYIKAGRGTKDIYGSWLWNGMGITSSTAQATYQLNAIGVLDNAFLPANYRKADLEGVPVDATAVMVKYTYYGDLNLDGVVDSNDLKLFITNYLTPPPASQMGWQAGDFNDDGKADSNDLKLFVYGYLNQGTLLGEATGLNGLTPADLQALLADGALKGIAGAVPEPATLALVALGAAALAGRRRRRR
jgi:autotransporter-associated beta strand protein